MSDASRWRTWVGVTLGAVLLFARVTGAQPLPPPPPRPPDVGQPPGEPPPEPPPPAPKREPARPPPEPPPSARPAPMPPPLQPPPSTRPASPPPQVAGAPRDPDAFRHEGFFLRAAMGYARLRSRGHLVPKQSGYLGQSSSTSPQQSMDGGGLAFQLAMGGTPLPGGVLAAELTSHMFVGPEVRYGGEKPGCEYGNCYSDEFGIKYTTAGVLGAYYPIDTAGFHSGLALGSLTAYYSSYGDGQSESGWYLAPELGYEWWAGSELSVGALLRVTFARLGEETSDYEHASNLALTSLSVTLTHH